MNIYMELNEVREKYFIDTSYIIALSSKKDQLHQKAVNIADIINKNKISLLTTEFILLELGNSFSKQHLKQKGIILIKSIYHDENIEVIKLSDKYYQLGLALYENTQDKNWSLTDCISFEILKDRNVRNVLTSDSHFTQAGFNKLL
ncbi:MAG: PIN domain-containing protein [Bacteroidetes bacterium]|nr:PIN domain-containing protein [Bacteroidota bacterium]